MRAAIFNTGIEGRKPKAPKSIIKFKALLLWLSPPDVFKSRIFLRCNPAMHARVSSGCPWLPFIERLIGGASCGVAHRDSSLTLSCTDASLLGRPGMPAPAETPLLQASEMGEQLHEGRRSRTGDEALGS